MKIPAGINKWGAVVLGAICALLVINLVAQYRAMRPGKSFTARATAPSTRMGRRTPHAASDLAQFDPTVHFDALKALDSRPLPDEDRNPFQFTGEAAAPPPTAVAAGPTSPVPLPPPPPPPLPLKAMGYNELPGGQKEAMLSYNDDVVVAHEGDLIGTKYKVLKIDPAKIVVEDSETHKEIELPFPP